jgi:type II secretory pathway pseudopilin PulG
MCATNRRTGYGLIELLVTIGVLALLVGLLIPAVQRVREAANRVKCANNLQQLGLATYAHHELFGWLPPANLGLQNPTWAFLILPFLDQQNLYDQWDFSRYWLFEIDTDKLRIDLPVFYCPSRGRTEGEWNRLKIAYFSSTCGNTHAPYDSRILYGTPSDYAASVGTGSTDVVDLISRPPRIPNGSIVSWPNKKGSRPIHGRQFNYVGLRFLQFHDGLGSTILIGEKHIPDSRVGEAPFDCSVWDGHFPPCNIRGAGPDYPLARDVREVTWSFGSAHLGVCQFVMCDASVRAIRTSIDPAVLGLLASRNDGQRVPED